MNELTKTHITQQNHVEAQQNETRNETRNVCCFFLTQHELEGQVLSQNSEKKMMKKERGKRIIEKCHTE